MHQCKARQYSDQVQCAACGLCWDVADADPPRCLTVSPALARYNQIRGETAVGCTVSVQDRKGMHRVTGWEDRGGLLYFKLRDWAEPVRAVRCKVIIDGGVTRV